MTAKFDSVNLDNANEVKSKISFQTFLKLTIGIFKKIKWTDFLYP